MSGIIKFRNLAVTTIQQAVHAAADALGQLRLANFTAGTVSNRVEEIDPLSEHYQASTIWDETNYNDAGPSTIYAYSDMAGFTRPSFQGDQNQGTGTISLTIHATWQDDGTAPAACAYEDFTLALTGLAAIAGTQTFTIVDNAGILEGCKYIRLEYVINTDPADDADFTIYHNKLWR